MRLNLSNSSKPIKRRRSVAHVVSGASNNFIAEGQSKIPFRKRAAGNNLTIDSKFCDLNDLDYWRQHARKFGVGLVKKKFCKVGKIYSVYGVGMIVPGGLGGGRQQLAIRKRRRSVRQQLQQQQCRRFLTLRKNSQCSLDMVDPDRISQWSVPLASSSGTDDDRLDCLFTNSHSLPLVRSHSQQNFCDCDETEIFCYDTAPIDLSINSPQDEYQANLSNVEPHLNYYVENSSKGFKIPEDDVNDDEQDDEYDGFDGTIQHDIKDEDNLFDSLCHSGCICSDNSDNQDLLRCAEIQKSEIISKAFLVYVDYYAAKCNVKILNGDDISAEARDKWQSLTQKEKLPFLLQAYISDYMPKN